ncbi:MAG: hypothetical protein ACKVT1_05235 [Dehalococcoidia bacterium]
MDDPVAVALAFADRQLAVLRAGDFDAYELAEKAYLEACHAAAALPTAGPGHERLSARVTQIAAELGRLRSETGAAMSRLRATRTVTSAYLETGPLPGASGRSA